MAQYKPGDIFHRFNFNLHTGNVNVDKFEIVDVNAHGNVKAKHVVDDGKTLKQNVYFSPANELGLVKTRGYYKYVLLDKDDEEKARKVVMEYLKRKEEEYSYKLSIVQGWIKSMEEGGM